MISLIVRMALCLSCLVAAARVSGQTIAPAASSAAASSPPACPWNDPSLRSHELQVTYLVWKHNVVPRYALVHPSGAYGGVWLRDSFWTLTALGDPALSGRALSHFAARQRPGGQVPTQFTNFLRGPIYHADESTLLFLIWSAWQSQAGGPHPGQALLRRALSYIRSQAPNGLYRSMPGAYASWFDSFKLAQADTLSYNQGLYAVALLAAQALHLDVTSAEVARGIAGYRALAARSGGYLRFSQRLAYHDISGLVGEYLSLWLFHRSLLDDKTVRATLATQTRFAGGFRVVEDAHGRYLPARAFLVRQPPGDYQNGASWLLYDYLALAVGYLHHLPGMGQRMHQRLQAEFHQGATFHEYLNSNPHARNYGREPRWRDGFSWDTHIVQVDTLLAHGCAAA